MGLLDKDNPAEDFYENKHLNSDLICCNFTELSDEEYYECLRWANSVLMKNYYDKQKTSTLAQIDHLYKNKDVSFRGFRHSQGQLGGTGDKSFNKAKSKSIAMQGSEVMDGLVNWENSSSDGDRFSQSGNYSNGNITTESFDKYLKKKTARATTKKLASQEKKLQRELSAI